MLLFSSHMTCVTISHSTIWEQSFQDTFLLSATLPGQQFYPPRFILLRPITFSAHVWFYSSCYNFHGKSFFYAFSHNLQIYLTQEYFSFFPILFLVPSLVLASSFCSCCPHSPIQRKAEEDILQTNIALIFLGCRKMRSL